MDTRLLERQAAEYIPQREQIRAELGFNSQQTVFIYSGKLIPKKDPLILARALQSLPGGERQQMGLIVVGDGELRQEFERECQAALAGQLKMVGFVNQSEIGRYYAASDCLVLPSVWGETWGLVVNEAMQFGVPVIVSNRVGCHRDLVVEGLTGQVFEAGDSAQLEQCLIKMRRLGMDERLAMAEACRRGISGYSTYEAVNGIKEMVYATTVVKPSEDKRRCA